MFYVFLFDFVFRLGELNAAELALQHRRQDTPGRRELECLQQVRTVLLDVQPRRLGVLGVDRDCVDVGVLRGLVGPAGVEVRLNVVQTLQLGLGTRRGCGGTHLLPTVCGLGGGLRQLRHEVHAQDADLLSRGDLARQGSLRHNRDVATLLGRQHVPLGRRLERLEQAALDRRDVLVKVARLARLRELDAVPLDGVALGAARVLAQRNERDREVLPDVLTQDQVRALPVSVRVRQGQAAQLAQRGQGSRHRSRCVQQHLIAPGEGGVVHTSIQLVEEGRVSEGRHLRRKGGKGGKRRKTMYSSMSVGAVLCARAGTAYQFFHMGGRMKKLMSPAAHQPTFAPAEHPSFQHSVESFPSFQDVFLQVRPPD